MSISKVLAWGPLTAITIMLTVTITVLNSIEMWLPPFQSIEGFVNYIIFWFLVGAMLFNFFNSIFLGAGFVPLGWAPQTLDVPFWEEFHKEPLSNELISQFLQYCYICKGFKAPRAHHCRRCNRCCLKMDHHCPWINNCCGHANHANFTLFLAFSVIGSIHSIILLSITLYRGFHATWYYQMDDPKRVVILSFYMFLACVLSIGLSLGVFFGVGMLLYVQLKVIFRNCTTIEEWIVIKANLRRAVPDYKFPYNLGWWNNFKQVFFNAGDGITWPVREDSHPYALTMEQIAQKLLKRDHTRPYRVIAVYSGRWMPIISQGCRVCLSSPFSSEDRLPLQIDQTILVTRWKKHWLYGQVCTTSDLLSSNQNITRGWFPRQCVIELQSYSANHSQSPSFTRKKQKEH